MNKLIERVKAILLTPKTEWPVIAAEPDTTAGLYTRYILIVSALGPIAMFLKSSLIGTTTLVGTFRMDVGTGLTMAVMTYVFGLVGIFLWSLIINALAPTFGGQKDSVQSLKTAAYAATGAWVGGLGQLIPWLGWLIGLAGAVYSVYLLYLGLPHTMKSPAEKSAGYTAVTIVVAIVLSWIIWSIIGGVIGRSMMGGPTVTIGDSALEQGRTGAPLEEWAKNIEQAGRQVEDSARQNQGAPSAAAVGALVGAVVAGGRNVDALSAEQLKAHLPDSLAGLPRINLTAERSSALGIEVSEAESDYSDGAGRTLHLELKDTGGAQGLIALASWAGVEEEREWQGGYQRSYKADGRIIHERQDGDRGEYRVVIGERFALGIEGEASVDELKTALASGVDVAALERLAAAGKSGG